jgi:hypothetical protein
VLETSAVDSPLVLRIQRISDDVISENFGMVAVEHRESLPSLDEVGFRPLDRHEANLFFRLVSARYERGSIVLTSNKHVRDWPEIFAGDEILTTAILDRLLHHVHIVHIDGRSYRLRELDGLLKPPTGAAQPAKKGGASAH